MTDEANIGAGYKDAIKESRSDDTYVRVRVRVRVKRMPPKQYIYIYYIYLFCILRNVQQYGKGALQNIYKGPST